MSKVAQTSKVVQLVLDMLEAPDQQLVLQQINKDLGLQVDVARLYSDADLAARYGVHVRTAREWITSGRVRGFQLDRRWYTRADWVDLYEQQTTTGNNVRCLGERTS